MDVYPLIFDRQQTLILESRHGVIMPVWVASVRESRQGPFRLIPTEIAVRRCSLGLGLSATRRPLAPPDGFMAMVELTGPFPCSGFGPSFTVGELL